MSALWIPALVTLACTHRASQDCGAATDDVLVVADGVSGAPAGATASRLATDAVLAHWRHPYMVAEEAHLSLVAHVADHPDDLGLSSTLTWASIGADVRGEASVTCHHVGDSACYHIAADGTATMISADHRAPNQGRGLSRWVGANASAPADETTFRVAAGDAVVLVTDGCELGRRTIGSVIAPYIGVNTNAWSAWRAADALVRIRLPHRDDATVAIAILPC